MLALTPFFDVAKVFRLRGCSRSYQCPGVTTRGKECGKTRNKTMQGDAYKILDALAETDPLALVGGTKDAEQQLKQLAGLLLCNYHTQQIDDTVTEWKKLIKAHLRDSYQPPAAPYHHHPTTPVAAESYPKYPASARVEHRVKQEPVDDTSSIHSGADNYSDSDDGDRRTLSQQGTGQSGSTPARGFRPRQQQRGRAGRDDEGLDAVRRQLEALTLENTKLAREVEKLKRESERLREQRDEAKSGRRRAEEHAEALEKERDELADQVDELYEQLNAQQDELDREECEE